MTGSLLVLSLILPSLLKDYGPKIQSTLKEDSSIHCQSTGRRQILQSSLLFALVGSNTYVPSCGALEEESQGITYSSEWTGTALTLLNLNKAAKLDHWEMARWPDPILRRPADPVDQELFATETLKTACKRLVETARREGAVGLAAQQCGVNARIVFLDDVTPFRSSSSLIMVNPRIVWRSPEMEMKVWKEKCLVLPPTFTATVLRDASVDIAYQNVNGHWELVHLTGQAARCAQHELDHDRGILLTDHVDLSELENDLMRSIERTGHMERMVDAFTRQVYEQPWEKRL